MKLLGIIAEYNPFHKGHAYHIAEAKRQTDCDTALVIMSGSCVQRGDFAIADKWTRAETAVKNGADLVCELPFVYAAQTAEIFAAGGVALLDAAKCETIAFGIERGAQRAESGEAADFSAWHTEKTSLQKASPVLRGRWHGEAVTEGDSPQHSCFKSAHDIFFENLKTIAAILSDESPEYQVALKKHLSEGRSFAVSRQKALNDYGVNSDCLSEANNILAVEYLKALKKQKSLMISCPIDRRGENHRSENINGEFLSATAIRKAVIENRIDTLQSALPYDADLFNSDAVNRFSADLEIMTLAELLKSSPDSLRQIAGINEGMEFALLNAVKSRYTLSGIIDAVSSKRIPKSRIRRILLHLLLNYTRDDFEALSKDPLPYYLRVLAFNDKGNAALKAIKQHSDIPIITNVHSNRTQLDAKAFAALKWDCRATELFYLLRHENEKIHSDFTNHPIILK